MFTATNDRLHSNETHILTYKLWICLFKSLNLRLWVFVVSKTHRSSILDDDFLRQQQTAIHSLLLFLGHIIILVLRTRLKTASVYRKRMCVDEERATEEGKRGEFQQFRAVLRPFSFASCTQQPSSRGETHGVRDDVGIIRFPPGHALRQRAHTWSKQENY